MVHALHGHRRGRPELYTDDLLIQYLVTQGTPRRRKSAATASHGTRRPISSPWRRTPKATTARLPQEHHALAQRRFPDQRPRIRDRRRRNAKYTGHAACRNTGRTAQTDGARRPLTERRSRTKAPCRSIAAGGYRKEGCRTHAAGSVCVEPVLAHTAFGDQFHFEMRRLLHRPSVTISRTRSNSLRSVSITTSSCTCKIICERIPSRRNASAICTIAIFMMSAALP